MITERELLNIIVVHTARTWELIRLTRPHEEMTQDNIESVESILQIADEVLQDKVLQEFLDPIEYENWDWIKKTGEGCSDTYIENLAYNIIIKDYL